MNYKLRHFDDDGAGPRTGTVLADGHYLAEGRHCAAPFRLLFRLFPLISASLRLVPLNKKYFFDTSSAMTIGFAITKAQKFLFANRRKADILNPTKLL
jgi:hypothetical protein